MKPFTKVLFAATVACLPFAVFAEPVAIHNAAELKAMTTLNFDVEYYLANDIDLADEADWQPIGFQAAAPANPNAFHGMLDGRGHAIKNMTINQPGQSFKGLFGRLNHATIKNLRLENVNIVSGGFAGGLTAAMFGECTVENVYISGNITGLHEVGGMVGRVMGNPDRPGYNIIRDSELDVNVKSTQTTGASNAGGVVGNANGNVGDQNANQGRVEFSRILVKGTVKSANTTNVAGNAAGIVTYYATKWLKFNEVIVLCDEIEGGTPNLFFCRETFTVEDFEQFNKVYARNDIALTYFDGANKGPGGELTPLTEDLATFKTADFYTGNSFSWDFTGVWEQTEGNLPQLRKSGSGTSLQYTQQPATFTAFTANGQLNISSNSGLPVAVFNAFGAKVYEGNQGKVSLPQGVYLVKAQNTVQKILVK